MRAVELKVSYTMDVRVLGINETWLFMKSMVSLKGEDLEMELCTHDPTILRVRA